MGEGWGGVGCGCEVGEEGVSGEKGFWFVVFVLWVCRVSVWSYMGWGSVILHLYV